MSIANQYKILDAYEKLLYDTRTSLREQGMTDRDITLKTYDFPNFNLLPVEDILKLYFDFQRRTVIYLHQMGFPFRKIIKMIGRSYYKRVWEILDNHKNKEKRELEKHVPMSEVKI